MEKEALKRIFEFLEEKEEHRPPFMWKHMNDMPLTKEELDVIGDLDLINAPITSLPKGLKVGGNLDLRRTKITSLPEGLYVGGTLYLAYTKIASLPEGLEVRGWLDIIETNITSLPKGLKVHASLDMARTELTKYTDDEIRHIIKPGFIKGKIFR